MLGSLRLCRVNVQLNSKTKTIGDSSNWATWNRANWQRRLLSTAPAGAQAAATNSPTTSSVENERGSGIINRWMDTYEEFLGIKAVKDAQAEVMKWEEKLSQAQMIRRVKQAELNGIQSRLKEIHFDLDRTSRGEDKYLQLLTEEHAIIKKERELISEFAGLETAEREAFHQLSNRVRSGHEKERERSEKTKWWGVSASLCGAILGIIGASIGNELRMRKLRDLLPLGSKQMTEMAKAIGEQNERVSEFITEMRDALNLEGSITVEPIKSEAFKQQDLEKVITTIRGENKQLSKQMEELTRLAKLDSALAADPNAVVYVGSDMERLLDQTERNLESKMKLQTLITVVIVYSAVAVTAPWIYAFFRGG
ncbi:hypothetical protein WR25_25413 [Diploscapter pachys]|uniref:Coiled-coil domain-containing protein 51 n=1 Tax=Diploscapter pachys TaxID=2018661 RepID=A0A2A2JG86_9BILA|nr:hypothetical protein WR25_25413 [Diploscapter pachys]